MHPTSVFKLLVAALSATTATQAFIIDGSLFSHDVRQFRRELVQRQADSSGSGNTVSTTKVVAATTTPSADTTSATPTSAADPVTTSSTTSTPDAAATPTPTSTSDPAATPSSTTSSATATDDSQTSSITSTESSTTATPTPTTSTTVVIVTQSDGSVSSSTSLTVSTPTASLSEGSSGSSNSGMSTQTRNTIIGVVVGVGGAIVLAVAGIFAWRIWGRRKNNDENDGLMGFKDTDAGTSGVGNVGVAPMSTTGAGSTASPFQSTLEQYHTTTLPQRNVNTAANF